MLEEALQVAERGCEDRSQSHMEFDTVGFALLSSSYSCVTRSDRDDDSFTWTQGCTTIALGLVWVLVFQG